jgi:ParB family chromosome partitioning protein
MTVLTHARSSTAVVPIADIRPNPRQPRHEFAEEELAELAASIRMDGILQPPTVRPVEGGYELIAGERRTRAAALAGLTDVTVIVCDVPDELLLRLALVENAQRSDLNPIEEAMAYQALIEDTGMTQAEIAASVGKNRQWVGHHLGLLKLPDSVQRRIAAGVLTRGHAKPLIALNDPAAAEALADRIVRENLSARAVEEICLLGDVTHVTPQRRRAPKRSAATLGDVDAALSDWLDTPVKVTSGRVKGRIEVTFAGREDLQRILALFADPTRPLRADR